MIYQQILDSDVDRLTDLAIQGVNAFITMYADENDEPFPERLVAHATARGRVMPRRAQR